MQQEQCKLMDPSDTHNGVVASTPTVRTMHDKPCVLVIDDEHMVRVLVKLGLERTGFDVSIASDGQKGIDIYRAHREEIDVVLLDVQMPGFDGPQTLDALRELNYEVTACFMSGDLGGYEVNELLRRGAAEVIAKPFRLDKLANILRELLQGAPEI